MYLHPGRDLPACRCACRRFNMIGQDEALASMCIVADLVPRACQGGDPRLLVTTSASTPLPAVLEAAVRPPTQSTDRVPTLPLLYQPAKVRFASATGVAAVHSRRSTASADHTLSLSS